ncbi:hypothetical protein EV1_032936 [Malus domestica]
MEAFRMERFFERDNEIEVTGKEKGFLRSYYAARVIANMGDNYVVEYKELLEDDERTHCKETVMAHDVRPPHPNQTLPSSPRDYSSAKKKFGFGEQVDAYDNDGWWVGIVTGVKGGFCTVFFETTWDHIAYPVTHLRPHLEWRNGRWFPGKNRGRFMVENSYFSRELVECILDEKIEQEKVKKLEVQRDHEHHRMQSGWEEKIVQSRTVWA